MSHGTAMKQAATGSKALLAQIGTTTQKIKSNPKCSPSVLSRPNRKAQHGKDPKPSRLLALPAELRNKIYEMALISQQAIEFCSVRYEDIDFPGCNGSYEDTALEEADELIQRVQKQNYANIGQFMPLLRVCKRVHQEATPIFYGQNEFRFSNRTGWVVLDHFLFTIGLENTKMLRRLTVCHPSFSFKPDSWRENTYFSKGFVGGIWKEKQKSAGFWYPKRWFDEPLTWDPAIVLRKASKLDHLCFTYCGGDESKEISTGTVEEFLSDLKVGIVSLREEKDGHGGIWGLPTSWPWNVRKYDELGCYESVLETSKSTRGL